MSEQNQPNGRDQRQGLSEEELQELVASSDSGSRNCRVRRDDDRHRGPDLVLLPGSARLPHRLLRPAVGHHQQQPTGASGVCDVPGIHGLPCTFEQSETPRPDPGLGPGVFRRLHFALRLLLLRQDRCNGGLADDTDKWFALAGIVVLFEAARRALGPAMAIVATVFLLYVFFGSSEWVPEVIRWKGASLQKAMSHMWITSEGVFGIALGSPPSSSSCSCSLASSSAPQNGSRKSSAGKALRCKRR